MIKIKLFIAHFNQTLILFLSVFTLGALTFHTTIKNYIYENYNISNIDNLIQFKKFIEK
jgi:hypothetical protein